MSLNLNQFCNRGKMAIKQQYLYLRRGIRCPQMESANLEIMFAFFIYLILFIVLLIVSKISEFNLIDWALLLIAAFNILVMCSNRAPNCIAAEIDFLLLSLRKCKLLLSLFKGRDTNCSVNHRL